MAINQQLVENCKHLELEVLFYIYLYSESNSDMNKRLNI